MICVINFNLYNGSNFDNGFFFVHFMQCNDAHFISFVPQTSTWGTDPKRTSEIVVLIYSNGCLICDSECNTKDYMYTNRESTSTKTYAVYHFWSMFTRTTRSLLKTFKVLSVRCGSPYYLYNIIETLDLTLTLWQVKLTRVYFNL